MPTNATSEQSSSDAPVPSRPGRTPRASGARAKPAAAAGRGAKLRLQKLLADAGVGSRRACEDMIVGGRVVVNGERRRDLPILVDPAVDVVEVDGERIAFAKARRSTTAAGQRLVYVMLYKPRHTLTTMFDPSGRRTVADIVDHPSGARLYPVGRLGFDTMGLVLLTNDGSLANELTHPRFGVHKRYRAVVKGTLNEEDAQHLRESLNAASRSDARTIGAPRRGGSGGSGEGIELTIIKAEATRTVLDLTFKEGRDQHVERLFLQVGRPVRKLVRIALGPVSLKGLAMGEWRELTPREVALLRASVRARGPKGLDFAPGATGSALKLGRSRAGMGVGAEGVESIEGEESWSEALDEGGYAESAPAPNLGNRPAPVRQRPDFPLGTGGPTGVLGGTLRGVSPDEQDDEPRPKKRAAKPQDQRPARPERSAGKGTGPRAPVAPSRGAPKGDPRRAVVADARGDSRRDAPRESAGTGGRVRPVKVSMDEGGGGLLGLRDGGAGRAPRGEKPEPARGGKPMGKPGAKPRAPFAGKPAGKSAGKPAGKKPGGGGGGRGDR